MVYGRKPATLHTNINTYYLSSGYINGWGRTASGMERGIISWAQSWSSSGFGHHQLGAGDWGLGHHRALTGTSSGRDWSIVGQGLGHHRAGIGASSGWDWCIIGHGLEHHRAGIGASSGRDCPEHHWAVIGASSGRDWSIIGQGLGHHRAGIGASSGWDWGIIGQGLGHHRAWIGASLPGCPGRAGNRLPSRSSMYLYSNTNQSATTEVGCLLVSS